MSKIFFSKFFMSIFFISFAVQKFCIQKEPGQRPDSIVQISIVAGNLLEIRLRMRTNRANLRCRIALADVAAVEALPKDLLTLLEYLVLLRVEQ